MNDKNEKNIDVPLNFIQMWEHLAEIADDLAVLHSSGAEYLYYRPGFIELLQCCRSNGFNTVRYTSQLNVVIRQEIGRVIQLLIADHMLGCT